MWVFFSVLFLLIYISRRTDNTIAIVKKEQIMIHKTLQRKLNIDLHELHKNGINSVAPEEFAFLTPLVQFKLNCNYVTVNQDRIKCNTV